HGGPVHSGLAPLGADPPVCGPRFPLTVPRSPAAPVPGGMAPDRGPNGTPAPGTTVSPPSPPARGRPGPPDQPHELRFQDWTSKTPCVVDVAGRAQLLPPTGIPEELDDDLGDVVVVQVGNEHGLGTGGFDHRGASQRDHRL